MTIFSKKSENSLEINLEELGSEQIRLIKSLNSMLLNVLITDDESEFFDGSAEFMRLCASSVKLANFTEKLKTEDGIPYADQALEYSMDILQDHINNSKVVSYDN